MTKAEEIWEKVKGLPYNSFGFEDVEVICRLSDLLPKNITILETGSLIGKSALVWAMATEGTVYTIDISQNQNQILENARNLGLEGRIIPIRGDSTKIEWDKIVDVVWLDSDHSSTHLIKEIRKFSPYAKYLICGHDYSHQNFQEVRKIVDGMFDNVRKDNNIWIKWIGDMEKYPTIDVVSLFIGRHYSVNQFIEGLENLDYPKLRMRLVWHDTSHDPKFSKILLDWIEKNRSQYLNINYIECSDPHYHFEETGIYPGNTENAMKTIKDGYNHALQFCTSDYMFALEDDVVGPSDGLKKLVDITKGDIKASCGVTLYRPSIGIFKSTPILWDIRVEETFPGEGIEVTARATMINERKESGIEIIGSGHLGFTLIDGDWIRENKFHVVVNGIAGCDTNIGLMLNKQGFKYAVDWSVKCKHYDIDGTFV